MVYYGILEKEPDTLWGVWFPDVPGCVTAGETADEATEKAISALREHLEGTEPPYASDAEALMVDPDVIEARGRGGILIRIPYLPNEAATVRVNVTLERGTLAAIDAAASARGMTRSAFLANAALEKVRASV